MDALEDVRRLWREGWSRTLKYIDLVEGGCWLQRQTQIIPRRLEYVNTSVRNSKGSTHWLCSCTLRDIALQRRLRLVKLCN